MKVLPSFALLALLGFCTFGLLATREPMDPSRQQQWRLIYGSIAAFAIAFLTWIWWPRAPTSEH